MTYPSAVIFNDVQTVQPSTVDPLVLNLRQEVKYVTPTDDSTYHPSIHPSVRPSVIIATKYRQCG